jgi:hypothetical protein
MQINRENISENRVFMSKNREFDCDKVISEHTNVKQSLLRETDED